MHARRNIQSVSTIVLKQIRWFSMGMYDGMEMDRECKCVLDYVWPSMVGEK